MHFQIIVTENKIDKKLIRNNIRIIRLKVRKNT